VGSWFFNPLGKNHPQSMESGLGVAVASKCGCSCLWLGRESLPRTQFPCKFKDKYLYILSYLLMNHDAVLFMMVKNLGIVLSCACLCMWLNLYVEMSLINVFNVSMHVLSLELMTLMNKPSNALNLKVNTK